MFPADVLAAVSQTFHVGYNYIRFILIVTIKVLVDVILVSSVVFLVSNVCPVQSPCWVLATSECFVEVSSSSFSSWWLEQTVLCHVFKGVDNTKLGRQVVVTVPLQVQICICGLFVY